MSKIDIPNKIGLEFSVHYDAFCNGVKIKDCFYADEEEGLVKFHLLNAKGNPYTTILNNPDKPPEIAWGSKTGKVEIRRIPGT